MKTYRIIVAAAFALALIAGVAAGVLATRFSSSPVIPAISTLDDLQLSPDQRDRVRQIWEKVRDESDDLYKQAQQLQHEHDEKILNLLTPQQKKQYQEIYDVDRDRYSRLMGDRQATLKKAIEDTRKLLSEAQQQKYDEILKTRLGRNAEPGTVWLSAPPATQPVAPGS